MKRSSKAAAAKTMTFMRRRFLKSEGAFFMWGSDSDLQPSGNKQWRVVFPWDRDGGRVERGLRGVKRQFKKPVALARKFLLVGQFGNRCQDLTE
jgi:hypothetical protein